MPWAYEPRPTGHHLRVKPGTLYKDSIYGELEMCLDQPEDEDDNGAPEGVFTYLAADGSVSVTDTSLVGEILGQFPNWAELGLMDKNEPFAHLLSQVLGVDV